MSEYRHRQDDFENMLLTELASESPSETRIRELVTLGVNLNAVEGTESLLMAAVYYTQYGLDLRFIRLLVELGADVNLMTSEDGECALWEACFTHRHEPVECLLELGANPNIVFDKFESVLDWAEFDQWYHEKESLSGFKDEEHAARAVELEKIVHALKKYGAASLSDIVDK